MEQLKGYLRTSFFNIANNKSYAFFYIAGTALAFVFITILLQLNYSITHNTIPYVYGDRTIHISDFRDNSGKNVGGILLDEQNGFIRNIKGAEAVAVSRDQYGNIFSQNAIHTGLITFVNLDFWSVNKFEFLYGRPFSETEYDSKKPVCVIKKELAEKIFGKRFPIGNHLEFQNTKFEVVGVVDDYSSFATMNTNNIWIPVSFNKYVPDPRKYYDMFILFPGETSVSFMKEQVGNAVKFYFQNKGIDVHIPSDGISTVNEEKMKIVGDNHGVLTLGVSLITLILLIIPALNIVTLNIANVDNRSFEISIRRALGATSLSVFIYLMFENFILVVIGLILGVIMTYPVVSLIENIFLDMPLVGKLSLLNGIDFIVIVAYLVPLGIVFTFLAGAVPAIKASKRNLAAELKGGKK